MQDVPLSCRQAIIVEAVMMSIAFVFLVLRLYVRCYILSRFDIVDALSIVAWIFFVFSLTSDIFIVKMGLWNPEIRYTTHGWPDFEKYVPDPVILEKALKLTYGAWIFYYLIVYCVKIAFLILYHQMFPQNFIKLRMTLYFTMGLVTVGFFLTLGLNYLYCMPISRNWSLDPSQRCLSWASPVSFYVTCAFNLITDFLVYGMPFFLLPTIYARTSRQKFMSVVLLFSIGTLTICCTITKFIVIGQSTSAAMAGMWSAAEQGCACIVVCCPPLHWIWSSRHYHLKRISKSRSRSRSKNSGEVDGDGHGTAVISVKDLEANVGATDPSTPSGNLLATSVPKTATRSAMRSHIMRDGTLMGSGLEEGQQVSNEECNTMMAGGLAPRKANEVVSVETDDVNEKQPEINHKAPERERSRTRPWKWKRIKRERAERDKKKVNMGLLTFGGNTGTNILAFREAIVEEDEPATPTNLEKSSSHPQKSKEPKRIPSTLHRLPQQSAVTVPNPSMSRTVSDPIFNSGIHFGHRRSASPGFGFLGVMTASSSTPTRDMSTSDYRDGHNYDRDSNTNYTLATTMSIADTNSDFMYDSGSSLNCALPSINTHRHSGLHDRRGSMTFGDSIFGSPA